MIARALLCIALCGSLAAAASQEPVRRNPGFFRASELLQRSDSGSSPRVRFEWEHVPGATRYVLSGQWTERHSWAVRSATYLLTPRNATSWQRDRVTSEVSLARGSHSWTVVAVFGPDERGDFASPARLSFELR